jgi:hypothetical protein
VVAAPAPHHAIARGRAGAGLLAHIVVSKYDDHFAKASRWKPRPCPAVGSVPIPAALQPLIDAFAGDVMASDSLHADDTPVPGWRPESAKPNPGGCGPTFATSDRSLASDRRRIVLLLA